MPVFSNVFEVVMQGTLAETSITKNLFNIFHYRLLSGSPDTPANIIAAVRTQLEVYYMANIATTDYTLTFWNGRYLDDVTVQYLAVTVGAAGSVALPRIPGDTAVACPLRCVQRGKEFRGMKHFSGTASAFVTKDELNVTGLAVWNVFAPKIGQVITTSNGSTMQPMVLSRKLSQLRTNPTTLAGSDINAVLLNKTIGTMRRRREKTIR